MARFKLFLNEIKSLFGRGLTAFDIDMTLFDTKAKILVLNKKTKKVERELSNQEFNTYKLKPDEEFDFQQFRDASLFFKTSMPIKKTINRINRMIKMLKKNDRQSDIILLSARGKFDSEFTFKEKLRDHGIDTSYLENIVLVGDSGGNISQRKKEVLMKYINTGQYRRIRLIDDDLKNLKNFLSLEKEVPNSTIEKIKKIHNVPEDEKFPVIQFFALQVLPTGTLKRIQ